MGRHNNDKYEAILLAAERLFQARRIHELTMDDVAQAAGVSKGTIYNYFQNKDDLLFQIATHGFDDLCTLIGSTQQTGLFQDRLVTLCAHISGFFQKRQAVMRMIQEHEGRLGCLSGSMKERWLTQRQRLVDAVASVLSQGCAEGLVRVDLPTDLLATLLLGLMRARGRDYAHMPAARPAVATVVEFFLHGAAAKADLVDAGALPPLDGNACQGFSGD